MKSLTLIGRCWFNKRTGCTYHSVDIIIDGKHAHTVPYRYGYDQQWECTGFDWCEANGHCPGREHHPNGSKEASWRYCERMGIKFNYSVTDVQRKKDL